MFAHQSEFLLIASLHKFLCLNASFFSTNDEVTREQRQQLTQQRNAKYIFGTLLNSPSDICANGQLSYIEMVGAIKNKLYWTRNGKTYLHARLIRYD